ncbi:YwdI family protein [Virgibacillus proomii]|uniref:YwdI family protein n=1 Tax=Virgibacillus proomii TaxID=84407 RepID=UPI001C1193CA|nr:YwdI family protein [Virgibacillus proomii]MBU5267939.1 YwdI family protein [Virgibacillus proomii]
MAVANATIINKMITELNKAKADPENITEMTKRISHVRLLCDLLLEEQPKTVNQTDEHTISQLELKAMIGEQDASKVIQQHQVSGNLSKLDHDGANGDSIFDF